MRDDGTDSSDVLSVSEMSGDRDGVLDLGDGHILVSERLGQDSAWSLHGNLSLSNPDLNYKSHSERQCFSHGLHAQIAASSSLLHAIVHHTRPEDD